MGKETMKFIRTNSVESAEKLRLCGYTELPQANDNTFCFMNDGCKLNFDAENLNIAYTNVLCF